MGAFRIFSGRGVLVVGYRIGFDICSDCVVIRVDGIGDKGWSIGVCGGGLGIEGFECRVRVAWFRE